MPDQSIDVTARIDPQLAGAMNDMARQIAAVGEDVRRGTQATVQAVQQVAESAARTELAKHQAEAKAIGPTIESQNKDLRKLFQQAREFVKSVKAKFDRKEVELKESYRRDLRRLGAHIFEILEDEYQRGIENRIRAADFDVFTSLTGKEFDRRNITLWSRLRAAKESASKFATKRRAFRTTLKEVQITTPVNGNPEFAVPFWIVEVEGEDGRRHTRVLSVSRLAIGGQGLYRYRIEPLSEFEMVRGLVEKKTDEVANRLPWRVASSEEKDAIAAAVEKLGPEEAAGDFKQLIIKQLQNSPLSLA